MHNFTKDFWDQHKLFLSMALEQATDENYGHRFAGTGSSVGFWLQHVAEAKLALLQAFWGITPTHPLPTMNGATDQGQAGSLEYIKQLTAVANEAVENKLVSYSQEELAQVQETFLGPMTVAQMFGVIIYHTYYHLGQAQLAMKRGQPNPVIEAIEEIA